MPGVEERERGYWRDVGTLDAYYDAHQDLISVNPTFSLYNRDWPILTNPGILPPAKVVNGGSVPDSLISHGRHRERLAGAPVGALAGGAGA